MGRPDALQREQNKRASLGLANTRNVKALSVVVAGLNAVLLLLLVSLREKQDGLQPVAAADVVVVLFQREKYSAVIQSIIEAPWLQLDRWWVMESARET